MFGKKIFTTAIVSAVICFSGLISAQEADRHEFVGTAKCGMCHKTEKQGSQLDIWKKSQHASAFETLKTDKAKSIAKEKGIKEAPHESKECLKCHTAAWEEGSKTSAKFKIEDGVQCETCHNAGEHYQAMKIMKDHDLAVKNGMREFKSKEDTEKFCKTCHNEKSPTFQGFDFAKYWDKIKHPIPEKK